MDILKWQTWYLIEQGMLLQSQEHPVFMMCQLSSSRINPNHNFGRIGMKKYVHLRLKDMIAKSQKT